VVEWGHELKNYKVVLRYNFKNDEESADYLIVAQGWDSTSAEDQGRRQWSINARDSRVLKDTHQWSEEGKRRQQLWAPAYLLAATFAKTLSQWEPDKVWLMTLPFGQRAEALRELPRLRLQAMSGLTGAAALGAGDDQSRTLAQSLRSCYEGGLVRAEPKTFFAANERMRAEIERAVRGLFSPGADQRFGLLTMAKYLPTWSEDDKRMQVRWGVTMEMANKDITKGTEWVVDGMIVMEAATPEPGKTEVEWRVAGLELFSSRRAPPESAAPGPPRRTMRGGR
jgi:hypothetical protein